MDWIYGAVIGFVLGTAITYYRQRGRIKALRAAIATLRLQMQDDNVDPRAAVEGWIRDKFSWL